MVDTRSVPDQQQILALLSILYRCPYASVDDELDVW